MAETDDKPGPTCPCCGKTMKKLSVTEQVKGFVAGSLEGDDFGELIVSLFSVMHNPEQGEPV